jgi:pilus assembly protein CpaB
LLTVPRRTLAAIAAAVLAVLGAVLLISWVSGADRRAMADLEPVEVLVVAEPVAAGTAADDMSALVRIETLPAAAVAEGAVASLKDVTGLVTTADLVPGEQVVAARFADPSETGGPGGAAVPEGLHEISVMLEPQRVLGGRVQAGSTVGVFASFADPAQTNLILHKVLVTSVQGAPATTEATDGEAAAQPVPEGALVVTLAVSAGDAEKVVFGSEHGTIWLSSEPEDAPEGGTGVRTRENIYQ